MSFPEVNGPVQGARAKAFFFHKMEGKSNGRTIMDLIRDLMAGALSSTPSSETGRVYRELSWVLERFRSEVEEGVRRD